MIQHLVELKRLAPYRESIMSDDVIKLVDGTNFLHRAYFADKRELTNSRGERVGAIKIFYSMLRGVYGHGGSRTIVVFDHKNGSDTRKAMYPDYKGNRSSKPGLNEQKPGAYELAKLFGFPVIRMEDVEADDVIMSIADACTEKKRKCIILSQDKDMKQCLSKFVMLQTPLTTFTVKTLKELGITPKQFAYILALEGDKVDCIPGVPGIGAVKALNLVRKYGSLKAILQEGDCKDALKVQENKELLRISYKLVKPIPVELPKIRWAEPDVKAIKRFCRKYEIAYEGLRTGWTE